MALGGCYSCIKYLMFAFNFLFWLIGCTLLGLGIWIRVDKNFDKYVNAQEEFNLLYIAAYVLIAIGVLVMIIGFLGCCGAIRESPLMLGGFFVFLFLIFAGLLAFGIFLIVSKNSLEEKVGSVMDTWVKNYWDDKAAKTIMDNIQEDFACCGSNIGVEDYKLNEEPKSCEEKNYGEPCVDVFTQWLQDHMQLFAIVLIIMAVVMPCKQRFFDWLADHMLIVAGVAIGIAIVLILGMIFSMVLCCAIREATP